MHQSHTIHSNRYHGGRGGGRDRTALELEHTPHTEYCTELSIRVSLTTRPPDPQLDILDLELAIRPGYIIQSQLWGPLGLGRVHCIPEMASLVSVETQSGLIPSK